MKIVYKIDGVQDRNGNEKTISQEWLNQEYILSRAAINHSAILPFADNSNYLRTSAVEDISIYDNHVKLTTKNTVYYFKPIIKEEF